MWLGAELVLRKQLLVRFTQQQQSIAYSWDDIRTQKSLDLFTRIVVA